MCTAAENKRTDEEINYSKLSGNIEIKNITFGYCRLEKPVIKNFSLNIKRVQVLH